MCNSFYSFKKLIVSVLTALLLTIQLTAQTAADQKSFQHQIPNRPGNAVWYTDQIVFDNPPSGTFDAVQRSDRSIFLAITDTIYGSNKIIIYRSNNLGVTWDFVNFVEPVGTVKNLKMIRSGLDSIYCAYQQNDVVYTWNIENNWHFLGGGYRSFDIAATTSGSLYIVADLEATNDIHYYSSIDGGANWSDYGILIDAAAYPKICKSQTADSLLITFYHPLETVISNSAIWVARFNEINPGVIVHSGFQEVVPSGITKNEFKAAQNGAYIWLLFGESLSSTNINISAMSSNDGGTTYTGPYVIAVNPDVQEYWFDIETNQDLGGFDLVYYSDSVQVGPSDNNTDKVCYHYIFSGIFFTSVLQISEHPPFWSPKDFKPNLIELPYEPGAIDCGVLWVGFDGTTPKVFWDRYMNSPVDVKDEVTLPTQFLLNQNYPNPFNPSTVISYNIPIVGNVTLKVYDILGNEIVTLVDKYQQPGKYSVQFNVETLHATSLPSGVYFYRLTAGNFSETKKLIFMK